MKTSEWSVIVIGIVSAIIAIIFTTLAIREHDKCPGRDASGDCIKSDIDQKARTLWIVAVIFILLTLGMPFTFMFIRG